MRNQLCFLGALLTSSLSLVAATPVLQDTTVPNQYTFTSATVRVTEDSTNAVLSAECRYGHRGMTGAIRYRVVAGSATAESDFTPVEGALYFSGPSGAVQQITVPVKMDALAEGTETLQVILENEGVVATATVEIVEAQAEAPRLTVRPTPGGGLQLSWAAHCSDFILERSTTPTGPDWTEISRPMTVTNGACTVLEPVSDTIQFYRLRRASR